VDEITEARNCISLTHHCNDGEPMNKKPSKEVIIDFMKKKLELDNYILDECFDNY
jgi:hypothetical protein